MVEQHYDSTSDRRGLILRPGLACVRHLTMVCAASPLCLRSLEQSLAEEFLADIGEDEIQPQVKKEAVDGAQLVGPLQPARAAAEEESSGSDEEEEEPDQNMVMDLPEDPKMLEQRLMEKLKGHELHHVVTLMRSERLKKLLGEIAQRMQVARDGEIVGPVEEDPEYKLILECNHILVDIGSELQLCHKFLRDIYAKKFAELETMVMNPVEYARVIKAIGTSTVRDHTDAHVGTHSRQDITKVNLAGILPPATILIVNVTATTLASKTLPEADQAKCFEACDEIIGLDDARHRILTFVESRMNFIAPNLTVMVGASIAAKLLSAAGGLTTLSKLPSSVVQVLGSNKKALAGFATHAVYANAHAGFIFNTDIIQKCPPGLRTKAIRLLAGKCTLAARIDAFRDSNVGSGKTFRDEIEARIEKWQEPPPPKQIKPLPAPDEVRKKRRGGKRARKQKEMYAMTDVRKFKNRVAFTLDSGEVEDTIAREGKDFGMLGMMSGSGKVRISAEHKKNLLKKAKTADKATPGTATSGLASSIAFTPVQGLELVVPDAAQQRIQDANERYFGTASTFARVSAGPSAAVFKKPELPVKKQ